MSNQVAVITGGGGSLGHATAVTLAERGYAVVVTGRTQATLDETVAAVQTAGGRATAVTGDAAEEAHVHAVFDQARTEYGPCDAFVHALGDHGTPMPIDDVSVAEWDHVISANLRSAFLCTRAAVLDMVPRGKGSIVLVGSPGIIKGFPFSSPYTAAKAGLAGFARAVATEVSPKGVRVNVLTPGPSPEAKIFKDAMPHIAAAMGGDPDESGAMLKAATALRRVCTPEDLARAVAFLVGDDSALMTGQNLIVDAGLTV